LCFVLSRQHDTSVLQQPSYLPVALSREIPEKLLNGNELGLAIKIDPKFGTKFWLNTVTMV
jgi:hypothetical protein